MTTAVAPLSESELLDIKARCHEFFCDYTEVVHGWAVRRHQVGMFSALQALSQGWLRHPDCPPCEYCREREKRVIDEYQLPYDVGYVASPSCPTCWTTNKLLIEGFVGCGKSDCLIEWAAWMLGRAVEAGVIAQAGWISYADEVADLRSIAIRDTIESNEHFQWIFPKAKPDKKKKWSEGMWFLKRDDPGKKDPTFRSAGILSSIHAFRLQTFEIMDDPQDPKQMRSDAYKDDTWRTWEDTIKTRATQGETPMVVTANRHAEDDIPGRLKAIESDWHVVRIPALVNEETVFPLETWRGIKIGISTEQLLLLREKSRRSFMGMYMCDPPSIEGGLFGVFVSDNVPARERVKKVIQFWDTATTQKSYSSYSAMVEFWHMENGRVCIRRAMKMKKKPFELTQIIRDQHYETEREFTCPVWVVIEDAQAGPNFIDGLRSAGIPVHGHKLKGHGKGSGRSGPQDLPARASGVVGYVESGIAFVPNGFETWKEDYLADMRAFPNGDSDDLASATIGGIEHLYHRKGRRPPVSNLRPAWAA